MNILLSIIIPTLNEENYVSILLQDLASQTDKDFEVIIVDGKSKDLTKQKSLEFLDRLPMTFIESPKQQVSYQRNLGAENAKGEYLFFLDADARVGSDVIGKLLSYIRQEHGIIYLPIITPSNSSIAYRILFRISIEAVLLFQKARRPLSLGPFIAIQKKFFDELDGFDETINISEDHNLVIRAFRKEVTAKFLKDVSCVFSVRRFESEGIWKVILQYFKFSFLTLIKGGISNNKILYEMGGQKYSKKV